MTRHALTGFELVATDAGAAATPAEVSWGSSVPAPVPGTAALALQQAGLLRDEDLPRFDERDYWWRARIDAAAAQRDERLVMRFGGVATVSDAWVAGHHILASRSMHQAHSVDVTGPLRGGGGDVVVCCRALGPRLRERHPRPRWRTRIVADQSLRFWRTSILGRSPGASPGPAIVGPYRAIEVIRLRPGSVAGAHVAAAVRDDAGLVSARVDLEPGRTDARAARLVVTGAGGQHAAPLTASASSLQGMVRVPDPARWWPHTHGTPVLYDVALDTEDGQTLLGRVGFRSLEPVGLPPRLEQEGLALRVNDVEVFCRGGLWLPHLLTPEPDRSMIDRVIGLMRAGGLNMIRFPGTGVYPSQALLDACDANGIMVWMDCMFANMDYPVEDEQFRALVVTEVEQEVRRLASRPAPVVVCGNSEVEQQVGMLGLDPALGRGSLFAELIPGVVAKQAPGLVYVPSSPCGGGEFAFRSGGVAHWFGVGAYRRGLGEVRRYDVRFASECLAFANIPDSALVARLTQGQSPVHTPRWKALVPRDNATGWDFDDVRDHYLAELFAVAPTQLRWVDPERYLDLSRAASGEAMARVLADWRRGASSCAGALILALNDSTPGIGWGVIDADGDPKAAYWHVARMCAPVAVWLTDEGLDGVAVHVANDTERTLHAMLRVSLYRHDDVRVEEARAGVRIDPRTTLAISTEQVLGHFVDAAGVYGFGPSGHRLVVASLEDDAGEPLHKGFLLIGAHPTSRIAASEAGLDVRVQTAADDSVIVRCCSRRMVYGAQLAAEGYQPSDNWFMLEPGQPSSVALCPMPGSRAFSGATLTALNLEGRVRIPAPGGDG